jgi:hypothetical protein
MRTKTLILSGIVAALSGASAMAQVYSLNAVGYINVDVPHGFSIIADQLYLTNQQTAQSVDAVFAPTLLNGGATTPDPYVGCILYPYASYPNALGYVGAILVQQNAGSPPFWSSSAEAQGTSFNPGQACFIYNPGSDFTMTFVGQVPQGTVTNTLQRGFNLISSIIPQTGAIDTDLGLTPGVGDIAFTYVSGQGYNLIDLYQTSGSSQFWSALHSPTNTVGLGFFYYSISATPNQWVRTFTIN